MNNIFEKNISTLCELLNNEDIYLIMLDFFIFYKLKDYWREK